MLPIFIFTLLDGIQHVNWVCGSEIQRLPLLPLSFTGHVLETVLSNPEALILCMPVSFMNFIVLFPEICGFDIYSGSSV